MAAPSFWNDHSVADVKIKELGTLIDVVNRYREIEVALAELEQHFNEAAFYEIKKKFRVFELQQLFNGPYDKQGAVLTVFPGAGGEDAADWSRMLALMYENFVKSRGWKLRVVDDNPRSRAVEIKGEYAYGYLKKNPACIAWCAFRRSRRNSCATRRSRSLKWCPIFRPSKNQRCRSPKRTLRLSSIVPAARADKT